MSTPGYITVVSPSSIQVIASTRISKIWTVSGMEVEKVDRERFESLDAQAVNVREVDILAPGVYWTQLEPVIYGR